MIPVFKWSEFEKKPNMLSIWILTLLHFVLFVNMFVKYFLLFFSGRLYQARGNPEIRALRRKGLS